LLCRVSLCGIGRLLAGMAGVGGVGLLVLQANGRLDAIGVAAALGGVLSMASGIVLAKKCSSGRIDQFSVAVESGRCCAGRLAGPWAIAVAGPDRWDGNHSRRRAGRHAEAIRRGSADGSAERPSAGSEDLSRTLSCRHDGWYLLMSLRDRATSNRFAHTVGSGVSDDH